MNLSRLFIIILALLSGISLSMGQNMSGSLNVNSIELKYPSPAVPFYHFQAKVDLPQPSIIEVRAIVNGEVLRSTDLYRSSDNPDPEFPPLTQRPPSGYGLSENATFYKGPLIVGWVAWQPGLSYTIELQIRLKKEVGGTEDDQWLSATREVEAPKGPGGYDTTWTNYKSV